MAVPVPGDGRYEWDGYFDMDVLPEEYNPERGFSGTANAMSLPEGYPINKYRVGFEWSAPWRYKRLWEVLQNQDKHSVEDSTNYNVTTSLYSRVKLLANSPISGSGARSRRYHDGGLGPQLERDSAAAALWNVWYHRHLEPALMTMLDEQ